MGFDPIGFVKDKASDVKDAGEAFVDTTEQVVETGTEAIGDGVDALETAAHKTYQFGADVTRAGLERTLEASQFIGDKASDAKDKAVEYGVRGYLFAKDKIHDATHPGFSDPPAAQGLEFSETKGASHLAYKGEEGKIYDFPNGEQWKVVEVSEDKDSGFRAVALQPVNSDDNRTVVAFKGTDLTSFKDWKANIGQAAGLSPTQYDEALAFAGKYKAREGGDNVILTGHSLGGALAGYAAIKLDLHATAIDSAPLALNNIGIDAADQTRITQYYVPGEVLSAVNKLNPGDARPGINIPVQGEHSILNPLSVVTNHGHGEIAPDIPYPKEHKDGDSSPEISFGKKAISFP